MEHVNLLVLADPATPQLAMLQTLAQTNITVGDTPGAFAQTAAAADVIFHWAADLAVFEQVWRVAPRRRWVHSRSAGPHGAFFSQIRANPLPPNQSRSRVPRNFLRAFLSAADLVRP